MALSVNCQEEVAFLPDGLFDEQTLELPELASVIADPTILDTAPSGMSAAPIRP